MTQEQVLLTVLRALRNSMATAVDLIDVVLDQAEKPAITAPPSDECPHPSARRLPKPSMGHPNRFHCTACNQDVEE